MCTIFLILLQICLDFNGIGHLDRFSLRVAMSVCVFVCATFCGCFKRFIGPIYKGGKSNRPIAKLFLRETLRQDTCLRFSGFLQKWSKIAERNFFGGICMDARRNLHGQTTEFAWTHNRICMDKQRNLHGAKQILSTFF